VKEKNNPFRNVPHTTREHFVLHLFAATCRLVDYVRRLAMAEGKDLDAVFEEHPFLAGYVGEMLPLMPQALTWEETAAWWEAGIGAWEQATEAHLPLRALGDAARLDFQGRLALMILGMVEEDARFGTLSARLQAPVAGRRPCLELVSQILRDPDGSAGHDAW
jgi:hypothetical protein